MKVPVPITAAAAFLLAGICSIPAAAAPPGSLDPTFAVAGKRTVAAPKSLAADSWKQVLVGASGQIYLIGSNADYDGAYIARLHHDGALDLEYGNQGIVSLSWQPAGDEFFVTAAALQGDGSKIVLGFGPSSKRGFRICLVSIEGEFDDTFGAAQTPGCITLGPDFSYVRKLLVQPDGKILVGGRMGYGGLLGIARLSSSGLPDPTFGSDGIFYFPGFVTFELSDMALAPDGDVVATGSMTTQFRDLFVARIDGVTGALVEDFGQSGVKAINFNQNGDDSGTAIAVLPDGAIVVAGRFFDDVKSHYRSAAAKLTSTGTADETFGPGGKRAYYPCTNYAFGCDIFIEDIDALPDGRIVLAGSITPDLAHVGKDFLAMRVLSNGELDGSFGTVDMAGATVVPFNLGGMFAGNTDVDDVSAVAMEGERILLAGFSAVSTGPDPDKDNRIDFAIARMDHGNNQKIAVTPSAGPGGALSPAAPQKILHSNRAEFVVLPDAGYTIAGIGAGPSDCGGGMDGEVYVTAPVLKACTARIRFKPIDPLIFADGFN